MGIANARTVASETNLNQDSIKEAILDNVIAKLGRTYFSPNI